jgi:hypothetical protein
VSESAQPGWQQARLVGALGALGALVSPPPGSGPPGGEHADAVGGEQAVGGDAALLAESPGSRPRRHCAPHDVAGGLNARGQRPAKPVTSAGASASRTVTDASVRP